MAYVPPGRRGKPQHPASESSEPSEEDAGLHVDDIHEHFWPPPPPPPSPDTDAVAPYSPRMLRSHGTLNASADDPNTLKYVVLFADANPRWESERIIFVKSNLELLPGGREVVRYFENEGKPSDEKVEQALRNVGSGKITAANVEDATERITQGMEAAKIHDNETAAAGTTDSDMTNVTPALLEPSDDTIAAHPPVVLFAQPSGLRGSRNKGFSYLSHARLSNIEYIPPMSERLVRVMAQKFGDGNRRHPEAWKQSWSYVWAVVKFDLAQDAGQRPEVKKTERVHHGRIDDDQGRTRGGRWARSGGKRGGDGKGVNQLLREMRGYDDSGNAPDSEQH